MYACIGTAAGHTFGVLLGNPRQRRLQFSLDRAPIRLPLPAGEFAAIIGQNKLEGSHLHSVASTFSYSMVHYVGHRVSGEWSYMGTHTIPLTTTTHHSLYRPCPAFPNPRNSPPASAPCLSSCIGWATSPPIAF